jgi:hypothetical protein
MDITKAVTDISHQANLMRARRAELCVVLSKTDCELNDYHHVLEFVPLSGADMVLLCKRQKQLYVTRRTIKEQISHIDVVLGSAIQECEKKIVNANAQKRQRDYIRESRQSYERLFGKTRQWPALA